MEERIRSVTRDSLFAEFHVDIDNANDQNSKIKKLEHENKSLNSKLNENNIELNSYQSIIEQHQNKINKQNTIITELT